MVTVEIIVTVEAVVASLTITTCAVVGCFRAVEGCFGAVVGVS